MKVLMLLPRWASIPAVLVSLCGVAHATYSGGLPQICRDVACREADSQFLHSEKERADILEDAAERMKNRIALKQAIISRYAEGKINLREVAREFYELTHADEEIMTSIRCCFPKARSDEEVMILSALSYIEVVAKQNKKVSVERARQEYDAIYPHHSH